MPSLKEVDITCKHYLGTYTGDGITFPSDALHVDDVPTTLPEEEIEFVLFLKHPELLDTLNWMSNPNLKNFGAKCPS